ncbi:YolD-like family protein [Oceanobacillus salinisoli]|uniref:YolD-like family protein n=1 Tax=Oceanobacillus salinisoli TaxID=2678611 RepID=UPI0012E25BC9|nr:YolD-like family protein [Oceanobacillus salinisoli]
MQRDRGSIKWTSLMLPEHVELLKEWWQEDKKVDMPILDSQQMEEINNQLIHAYKLCTAVTISIYQQSTVADYTGKVIKLDNIKNCMVFQLENGTSMDVGFHQILSVTS